MGGGGVDGAIHRRGGPKILEECVSIRWRDYPKGLPRGSAVITSGALLKARHVIHTVGPFWQGGTNGEAKVLADCYLNSLSLAKTCKLRSIAFPSISTSAYGYPIELASKVALKTVRTFLLEGSPLDVTFVLFTDGYLRTYEQVAKEYI